MWPQLNEFPEQHNFCGDRNQDSGCLGNGGNFLGCRNVLDLDAGIGDICSCLNYTSNYT